jgi:hypothetical protein
MNTPKIKKNRPYWHVDAKWLTGILLVGLLTVTLLMFILVQATGPVQGKGILTSMLASSFSYGSGGLDSNADLEIMRQKIAQSPNGEWQPIPGLPIIVRLSDIEGKTAREVRMWFFAQMADPLYQNGAQGLVDFATDPQMKAAFEQGVGPLGFISAATHAKILSIFAVFGLVSLLFLLLLIFFSYRFGKLGSPGCVLFLAAIPGVLLFGGLNGWINQMTQNPIPFADQTAVTRYAQLAADVLPVVLKSALQTYLILTLLGLVLVGVALLGSIFIREKKKIEVPKPDEN